ncbi:MAG: HAD family hydrolase [Clostridium sp.]
MNKKIIFFDGDGTIIKNNFITDKTKEAFKRLRENGHVLVLSTGRAYPAVDGILSELNFENMICSAGATVVVNKEILFSKPMSYESRKELVEYFEEHNIVYNLEGNDYVYIKKGHKEKYLKLFTPPNKEEVSEEEYARALDRIEKISLRTREIENPMDVTFNKIHYYGAEILYSEGVCPIDFKDVREKFKDRYTCVSLSLSKLFSGGEVCEKDISKALGIKEMLKYYNFNLDDVYAIGDDYNDIDMLKFVKNSIAMGNSPQAVKDVSSYVTKSFEEDGFYEAMKTFELI